jgi:signal transduction histidine kinase
MTATLAGMTAAAERQMTGAAATPNQMDCLREALHDVCQPLTALQFLLEVARSAGGDGPQRETLDAGLAECSRLRALVNVMREHLRAEEPLLEGNGGGR